MNDDANSQRVSSVSQAPLSLHDRASSTLISFRLGLGRRNYNAFELHHPSMMLEPDYMRRAFLHDLLDHSFSRGISI